MSDPKLGGDGGNAHDPTNSENGLILCVDAAEARLVRRAGGHAVTSAKARATLAKILMSSEDPTDAALLAVGRLGAVSTADNPESWSLWKSPSVRVSPAFGPVRAALKALPRFETPLKDPEDAKSLDALHLWPCSGTTVLVAEDTFSLVRAADTYAKYKPYRPHGRMDEPFAPVPGRVCLITADELRLIRLNSSEDNEIVLTYKLEDEKAPGMAATPRWPASVRALCGEFSGLRVGIAPALVHGRHGYPFFLGLTRGLAFETDAETGTDGDAALEYRVQTNREPEKVGLRVVVWHGGDDPRMLARYGGLCIFTGMGRRRKVQLRSLGLARSDIVAGAPVYDLGSNYDTLQRWAVTRTFARQDTGMRGRNGRRVRRKKSVTRIHRGDIYNTIQSPRCIQVTPSKGRQASLYLRRMMIAESTEGGGVATVRLESLRDGKTYRLNGRAVEKDGETWLEGKRCRIRCARFLPEEPERMLEWLKEEPHAVAAGRDADGAVFAVVRVANGTEDQQREAAARWCEAAGRRFPHESGTVSWIRESVGLSETVTVRSISHTNWRASALETACYERYQTAGEYLKPLKIERGGTASASDRARAYADRAELGEAGTRDCRLASVMLNVRDMFGREALKEILPELLARSTLPERRKRRMAERILKENERSEGK